jgi:hypothetical protein
VPAYLARAVSTRDDVSSLRLLGDEVDERLALIFCPDRIGLPLKRRSFNDRQHGIDCTPNKFDSSRASLSK